MLDNIIDDEKAILSSQSALGKRFSGETIRMCQGNIVNHIRLFNNSVYQYIVGISDNYELNTYEIIDILDYYLDLDTKYCDEFIKETYKNMSQETADNAKTDLFNTIYNI